MIVQQAWLRRGTTQVILMLGCMVACDAAEPDVNVPKTREPGLTVRQFDKVQPQEFPWGWIRWLINAEVDPAAEMTFGTVYIKPNQKNPLHLHPNSAEYLHVIEGTCEHLVGSKWVKLKAGDTVRIPRNVPHRARTTNEACRAVIVYDTGKRQMVHLDDESGEAQKKE
jgi:quercetin dioxygenase-like cupin family protein